MGDARHFLVHRDITPRGTPDFFRHTPDLCGNLTPRSNPPTGGRRQQVTFGPTGGDKITNGNMAAEKSKDAEYIKRLKPEILNVHHQDSVFGNAFGSRSYYTVHPEWVSETGSNPQPDPLHRPPWPWEQPRYRVNMQVPITYQTPDEGIPVVDSKKELEKEEDKFCQEELPPISYQLSQMYKSTHPAYVLRH